MQEIIINIYCKYKVKIHKNYSYIDPESESIYDNIFIKDNFNYEAIIDGGQLMIMIIDRLKQNDISEYIIKDNEFIFEYFNAMNGESGTEKFVIMEVK